MPALDRMFPRKVCINLQRRPDRWQHMLDQFTRHGLADVVRHDAADGLILTSPAGWPTTAGAYGCLMSHREVVRGARERGDPAVLILEDDVIFHADFRERFEEYAGQLPADWDALYLGAIHVADPIPVAPNVAWMQESFSTYAYGLRSTAYEAFLDDAGKQLRPADHTTRAMQRQFRFYCFTPHLAWVTEDYSDIKNGNVNSWWLRDPVAMKGEKIQRLLSRTVVLLRMAEPDGVTDQELRDCVTQFYAEMKLRVRFVPASRMGAGIVELMEGGDEYAVVADAAVFPYQWEFKAGLLKLLEYDRVLPAHRPFPLSPEDTRLILRRQIHDVDTLRYERVPADGDDSEFCMLSRAALAAGGDREPTTFHSPGRLLRLHPGARSL